MYQLDIHKIADCIFFLDFFFRGTELLLRGILYLYVDTFREHDLFSQEFLCLYITYVCVYTRPSQIWRIPVGPLACTCVTRYTRSVTDSRVCTHRAYHVCLCIREDTIDKGINSLLRVNECDFAIFDNN